MATVTKPIALDESLNTTELSSRNVADVLAQELSAVATAIVGISAPSAEDVSYDNTDSGLTADNVQDAIDELKSDIPTVNNGTLTIQQNGTSKGTFTANSASNVNVNIETPTADKKTATDQFITADGGLLSKCQINLVPVQSGSGDPSPDNVRPISGHTEVGLANVGKNIIGNLRVGLTQASGNYVNRPQTVTNNDGNGHSAIYIKANQTYVISGYGLNVATAIVMNNGVVVDNFADTWKNLPYSFTPLHDGELFVSLQVNDQGTINPDLTTDHAQVEKGNQKTDYEPYLGHLYTINLGGTYYGGYDEIVSGSGKSTYAVADFGDLTWYYDSANTRFRGEMPSNYKQPTSSSDRYQYLYCSCYKPDDSPVTGSHVNNTIGGFQGTTYIFVNDSAYTDAGQFKTARTGQKIAYLLATPTDITHNSTQIETLAGQNNLSCPLEGQSLETNGTEYKELFTFADVKELIAEKVPDAPTTDGTYTLTATVSSGVATYSWT